jgi:hypothetical protein
MGMPQYGSGISIIIPRDDAAEGSGVSIEDAGLTSARIGTASDGGGGEGTLDRRRDGELAFAMVRTCEQGVVRRSWA